MHFAKPLPNNLIKRYMGWRATGFSENKAWYKRLAEEGQHPRAMIISCCDSRVHATSIFGADSGEFFIHRNIANLVPPFETDGGLHGTSATIEYAVTALKVAHIIVLGHSNCGGVKGCIDMCSGNAPQLEEDSSFVGRWIDILRPGYEKVKKTPYSKLYQLLWIDNSLSIYRKKQIIKRCFTYLKEASYLQDFEFEETKLKMIFNEKCMWDFLI